MTSPNPFAQNVPAATQPAAPTQPAPNPFAQQAPQQTAPAVQQAPQAYAPPAVAQPDVQQGAPNPFAQQQAAPQAYAPQQGYAPQTNPPAPYGQYGQAQQAAPLPVLGTASAPPPPVAGGGKGAKFADMYGRLVLVFPITLQTVPKNVKFLTEADRASGNVNQDRLTATVVVLDGGSVNDMRPIAWGGNPQALGGAPHTNSDPLPYVRKGMWVTQSQVIGQVSPYLPGRERGGPNGAPGVAVGRIVKTGPGNNDPWFLTTPSEAELNLANQYLAMVQAGQFPHPLAP